MFSPSRTHSLGHVWQENSTALVFDLAILDCSCVHRVENAAQFATPSKTGTMSSSPTTQQWKLLNANSLHLTLFETFLHQK